MQKKRILTTALFGLCFLGSSLGQTVDREKQVRRAVQSFYAAFSAHDFAQAKDYTTEDWSHINPFGGMTQGRLATLKDLHQVHSTFLKGVSDTIEDLSVRFATRDVAVATVVSRVSRYQTPDGVTHENEQHLRTFVVVKRSGHWQIMHDQNTIIRR